MEKLWYLAKKFHMNSTNRWYNMYLSPVSICLYTVVIHKNIWRFFAKIVQSKGSGGFLGGVFCWVSHIEQQRSVNVKKKQALRGLYVKFWGRIVHYFPILYGAVLRRLITLQQW